MVGAVVGGKYRVIRELGSGAMGSVYLAEHTGTRGRVALKVITGELGQNADIVKRFEREAMAGGIIDSQYVTKVSDTGVDAATGRPFLVMELLSGQDLESFLKAGPISSDLALRIIAQACIGLQKAHDAGVIHRDIKPSNMFLARREEGEVVVKLLDFGIAKMSADPAQENVSVNLTAAGRVPGTPLYMSPEQALSKADLDRRSDVWSVGVTLYEALCGRAPFQHITDYGTLILELNTGRLPPIQEFAPWIHADVAAVVHQALRREPSERFQSASAMLAAIKQLLPDGSTTIREGMLVPLAESARADAQARPHMPSSPSALTAPVQRSEVTPPAAPSTGPTQADSPPLQRSGMRPSAPSATGTAQTGGALVRTNAAPSQRRPMSPLVPLLGLGGVLLTAVVLIFLIRGAFRADQPVSPSAPSTVASTTQAPQPTPPPTTAPTPSPSAEPAEKHFRLVILPDFASVEVDGKAAEVHDGTVELVGRLGQVFSVKVFKGPYSRVELVSISEQGLLPAKVDLYSKKSANPQGASSGGQTTTSSGHFDTRYH